MMKMKHRVKVWIFDDIKDIYGNAGLSRNVGGNDADNNSRSRECILREKMGNLQHNKTIIVDSVAVKKSDMRLYQSFMAWVLCTK